MSPPPSRTVIRSTPRRALVACAAGLAVQAASAQALSYQDVLARPGRPPPTLTLTYAPQVRLQGELWLPSGAPAPYPVVVLIHGGCWRADLPGPELLAWQAQALADRGLAVWSIRYRRIGEPGGGYPGTFTDVGRGIDQLRELAQTYPLDLRHVVATGHSAGGHLALWAARRAQLPPESPLYTPQPLAIASAVPVAGISDLPWAAQNLPACGPGTIERLVDADARGGSAWSDTSPDALPPPAGQTLLISGGKDRIVTTAHALRALRNAGPQQPGLRSVVLEDAGHFELIAPWTSAGERVVSLIHEEARPRP